MHTARRRCISGDSPVVRHSVIAGFLAASMAGFSQQQSALPDSPQQQTVPDAPSPQTSLPSYGTITPGSGHRQALQRPPLRLTTFRPRLQAPRFLRALQTRLPRRRARRLTCRPQARVRVPLLPSAPAPTLSKSPSPSRIPRTNWFPVSPGAKFASTRTIFVSTWPSTPRTLRPSPSHS